MAVSHKYLCREWFALCLLAGVLGVLLSCNLPAQEIPPSGTLIINQADVTYIDPSTLQPVAIKSDSVSVRVEAYERFSLVEDRNIVAFSGERVELPHTLINNGTVPLNITLTYYNLGGDDFDLANLKLIKDLNNNGRYDEGEPEIPSGSGYNGLVRNSAEPSKLPIKSLNLNVNERISLILVGVVPSADPGKQAKIALIASNPTMTYSVTNIDTITIGSALPFTITKSASIATGSPGDEINYTITLTPNTSSDLSFNITVDGVVKKAVVVRDIIPANTQFSGVSPTAGATTIYHIRGSPVHQYVSVEPLDLSTVDAIAWMITSPTKGTPITLSFKVKTLPNANGTIRNIAGVYYSDGISPTPILISSSPVDVDIKGAEPKIEFYQNNLFADTAMRIYLGSPLFIQANAAACNLMPDVVESNLVTVTSTLTGDKETFWAIESGPNTGLFRIENVPTQLSQTGKPGDGIIQTVKGDTLIAEMTGCGAARVTTEVLVSAAGIVFDSKNNQPVAGARVTLYDPVTGEMALVYAADGKTLVPASVVTDSNGEYEFPFVRPGVYKIVVEPPAGYVAPSQLSPSSAPANRNVHPQASYNVAFRIIGSGMPVNFDIPVDPAPAIATGIGLFVRKSVSRTIVEAGEFVDYSIEVKNVSGTDLTDVTVTDILPYGFLYESGTTRLNRQPAQDPQKSGSTLVFTIGALNDQKIATITYRVKVTPFALKGNGVNRAVAKGGAFFSNEAAVQVKIEPGVFTDKGVIIGKVFVDLNNNKIQDEGEPGVPGVRLFMEDGSFVITDSEGKYNFYGVTPKTHVIKVDPITLPKGAKLVELSTRNAFSPGTRFVDLKNGELHKADFAISGSTTNIIKIIEERKKFLEKSGGEIDSAVSVPLSADGSVVLPGDLKAQPASGIKSTGTNAVPSLTGNLTVSAESKGKQEKTDEKSQPQLPYTPLLPEGTLNNNNSQLPTKPIQVSRPPSLENVISNCDNKLDFIDLKDGDVLLAPQINIRIKGPMDSRFELYLNDEKVPENRIGKRTKYAPNQVEAWEYIGINMKPGTNTLNLKLFDPFGNQRGEKKISVVAPDKLGKIKIILPEKAYADDPEPAVIKVELTDSKGILVTARTPLTLESSAGRWDVEDLNKSEPGVQTFIEAGKAEFKLIPPIESGDAKIIVSSGTLREEAILAFMPRLRPMLAVGVIEGAIHLNKVGLSAITPARERDSFERELRNFAFQSNDGKLYGGGRTAFYLKGKIKGEYLLTAAYDSDKDTKERMFRDIQPDEYYPVYGDSSVKGFDAQSTGRLYVRIDHRKSYLLYGDYNTMSQNPEVVSLGNYNRSLTGIREHYEKKNIVANVWASYDSTRQMVEEVPANGTSGPYFLNIRDGIVNSEKVEILTRDRNQPSVILKTEQMSRFTDYEFEPFTGRILFRRPIPSLDPNLNPISIRVTYELDQGGSKFWVYGADAQVKVTKNLEVGGTAVRDENPLNNYELYSANSTLKVAKNTYVIGEVARSSDEIVGTGYAERIELRHKGQDTDARIYYGRSDTTFSNTTSFLTSGRVEGGAKVTHRITPTTRLILQSIYSEDVSTGGNRKGVRADIEQSLSRNVKLELGGRYSTESATPASPEMTGLTPNEVRSLRTKLTVPMPIVTNASMYGEYENDIIETENKMAAFGADVQLKNNGRFYARHEFINSLGSQFELNSVQSRHATVIGLETEYMKNGQMFNEYRVSDAMSGREAEAAIGLRNQWTLSDGLRLNTSFERINPVNGGYENEATAIAGALEYTRPENWKGTARLEFRTSESSDSYLNTLGYARKLSEDWTFLGKTILYYNDNKGPGTGDKTQARIQSGLAWRQTKIDKWNGIGKYEFKHEDDASQPSLRLDRNVHILSLNVNYQPVQEWTFSMHYAGKYVQENSLGIDSEYHSHLINNRAIYEISRVVDIGLNTSVMLEGKSGELVYGFGPEIGFTIKRNLRIGVGFNFFGFHDRDLSQDVNTDRGVYINMKLKFDETLFGKQNDK